MAEIKTVFKVEKVLFTMNFELETIKGVCTIGSKRNARANASLCFWPTDNFTPLSPTTVVVIS
jgi:alkyl hydroperoxide reductase subunit AhpC